MPKRAQEEKKEQNAINPNDPAYCPICHKLSMASLPVHIRELDGTDTEVCKVVKCGYCRKIKHYGMQMAIGKLKGRHMLTDYANWEELRRNYINPDDFIDAVLNSQEMHIWLDASNGLKAVEPEGEAAEMLKRLHSFARTHGHFWRMYD